MSQSPKKKGISKNESSRRRNLTDYTRIELALLLKPLIEDRAP